MYLWICNISTEWRQNIERKTYIFYNSKHQYMSVNKQCLRKLKPSPYKFLSPPFFLHAAYYCWKVAIDFGYCCWYFLHAYEEQSGKTNSMSGRFQVGPKKSNWGNGCIVASICMNEMLLSRGKWFKLKIDRRWFVYLLLPFICFSIGRCN